MRRYIFSNICVGLLLSISLVACKQTATALPIVATRTPGLVATASPEGPIKIRWFIGVGTGRTPDEVNTAREFVKEYNESQGKIELELEVVTTSTHDAIDRLMGEIEAGNPPDIVAPADKGWAGEQLTGYILALEPAQVEAELADINVKVLDTWSESGKLIGVPAGVYPSAIFYNKSLFDAAKLPYPPHRFGEPYADGDPWTIEKMEEIATSIERAVQRKSDREVSSSRIGELIMEKLKILDDVAYVRFASVYRQFKDVSQFMEELKDILGKEKIKAKAKR